MDDTLLFCPLDGQKIVIANTHARCPIHGYIENINETWQNSKTVISYEFIGDFVKFTDEDAIQKLLHTDIDGEFDTVGEVLQSDEIKKPSHYNQYTGFEVMDVCRQLVSPDATPASTWFRGNVFKYLARAGWKPGVGKETEDLKKAFEYLRREIERIEKRDEFLDKTSEEEKAREFAVAILKMGTYQPEEEHQYRIVAGEEIDSTCGIRGCSFHPQN